MKGTLNTKLIFSKNRKYDELQCYCDSDWASSFCDRKSCTGYVYLWQGGPIAWHSKKQPTVALSTTEAEYMAITSASQEALWMKQLIDEILSESTSAIEIFCDNKGARDLCENGNYSARTKHIDIKYYFVRDLIEKNKIKISKVGTDSMVADSLTKALPIPKHTFCFNEMGLVNSK